VICYLRIRPILYTFVVLATTCGSVPHCAADETPPPASDGAFASLKSFAEMYCTTCHAGDDPQADFGLDQVLARARVEEDYETWQTVHFMLSEREMPPDGETQPTDAERAAAIAALEALFAEVDCGGEPRPGRVTIRRLNRAEYNNTIRDLVGVDFRPADDFPSDDVGNGFDNIGAVLSIPPVLVEKYLAAAEEIVAKAWANDAAREELLVRPLGEDRREFNQAARANIHAFATRAFRRRVGDDEIDRLMDLVRTARENDFSRDEALQGALQAILVSPHFLFRVERDPEPEDEDGIRELNDFELASRLSYFLWSSMPDNALFDLALDGKLRDPKVLQAQVRRMLLDSKSEAIIKNFAGQWLQLRDLANLSPDPDQFPEFDQDLRAAMLRETEFFFAEIIREDRSVLDFLNADFTFVNDRLAGHYGIDNVAGDEFRRVPLPEGRRGVLTQASILLITSNPTRTSPVKRGKWILENILGDPPPPPPDGVEELAEDAETIGTLREQMEQHRANPTCASCHERMDPLGFGLENFNAIGAWRDTQGGEAIDATGKLPGGGGDFQGPSELMDLLAGQKREEFCRCLTKKMLTYALGRGLESYDRCAVEAVLARLAEHDFRFSELVIGIVLSDPFRMRER
jgi:hypothetical protein